MKPQKPSQSNSSSLPHTSLNKKKLYADLSDQYFLPPFSSKGVSIPYLLDVQNDTVFRITHQDIKRFMFDVMPSQLKRALYTNKSEAYQKINQILIENKRKPLGFKEGVIPDGDWLYQVARIVDPCNTSGLFNESLKSPEECQDISSQVLVAKKRAEKKILLDENLMGKREVYESVKEICEVQKRLVSHQLKLDQMFVSGRKLAEKVEAEKVELKEKVRNAAIEVRLAKRKNWNEEVMIEEESEEMRELREK